MGEFMRVLAQLIREASEEVRYEDKYILKKVESHVNHCHGMSPMEMKTYLLARVTDENRAIMEMLYPFD